MRDSFWLRQRKKIVVLGIRVISLLAYVVFIGKLPTWKVEEFHDESFGFGFNSFGGELVMRVCNENPLFSVEFCL